MQIIVLFVQRVSEFDLFILVIFYTKKDKRISYPLELIDR